MICWSQDSASVFFSKEIRYELFVMGKQFKSHHGREIVKIVSEMKFFLSVLFRSHKHCEYHSFTEY